MIKVTKMSSAKDLKRFVIECLVAASEEIFGVFQRKMDEYEEEIDRQRRMLAVARPPVIKLHRTELLEQLINKEEDVLTDQQLCNQERNSSLDKEDPEPPQIKEEQEELYSSQDGEQLLLKQEIDAFILTPVLEENGHFEDQNLDLNPFEIVDRSIVSMPVLSSVVSVPNTDLQLLSNSFHGAEIKDQKEGKHDVCGSTEDAETEQENQHHKNNCHRSKVRNSRKIRSHCDTDSVKKIFKCKMCGKYFKWSKSLSAHLKIHTDGKSFVCKTGGKYFSRGNTHKHIRIHADERPYSCTCGKSFKYCCQLISHMRMHTGEKPYACDTCGKGFSHMGNLSRHMRIHTGERPFVCTMCGNAFNQSSHLLNHMKSHTHRKPTMSSKDVSFQTLVSI